jgi:hypothetical protein
MDKGREINVSCIKNFMELLIEEEEVSSKINM